jgi:ABC-type tungstate transport system permease subunit
VGGSVTRLLRAVAIGGLLGSTASPAVAQHPFITVASTTSTEESGLFGFLLPAFTKETGIEVRVVAVGTGQALKIGERGDCDVVFVHDRPAELAFVEHGFGIDRREVMYNDFILVGPASDPARVDGGNGTWLNFKNRQNLKIVVQGDRRLFNQYGAMLVNPARYPSVKQDLGHKFINWLTSPTGQQTIAEYKINNEQLFFPDAEPSSG